MNRTNAAWTCSSCNAQHLTTVHYCNQCYFIEIPSAQWKDDLSSIHKYSLEQQQFHLTSTLGSATRSIIIEGRSYEPPKHVQSHSHPYKSFYPTTLHLIKPILEALGLPTIPNNIIWNYYWGKYTVGFHIDKAPWVIVLSITLSGTATAIFQPRGWAPSQSP